MIPLKKTDPPSPNPPERPSRHALGFPREECAGGPRPCPLVSCPYNLYLSVSSWGHIQLSHPDREPEDVPPKESCSLDLADEGPQTLDHIGHVMGLTRERIRQIELIALKKLHTGLVKAGVDLSNFRMKRD